ncbi:MAG TPA: sugar ABC transporter permease [Geminicoccaceae bacterium]|nr:sugar ABC transporter permease [Geminicoccaceae bacterium]
MTLLRRHEGFLFALPALLALAALIFYPLVYTAVLSVTDPAGAFIGGQNYERVLSSRTTETALRNTVIYVGASICFQVLLGTAVGILLNQPFRGRAVVRSMTLIPWVIPGIVAATTWAWMFHTEFGITNYMLLQAGLIDQPRSWLTGADTVLPAVIAVNVWKMFPFVAIMVLAGLQAVPESLYEAARVDGATFWDEVRHIMLPHLRPVLLSITLLLMIWGLNGITIIYAMTQGGPANRSLITPIQIYKHAFEFFRLNEAAALSLAFFAVVGVLTAIYIYAFGNTDAE